MKYQVYFFPNGNIAVTDGNEQIPELQSESMVSLFCKHAESKGYNPLDFELHFGDGTANPFRTSEGHFSWKFV